MNPFAYFAWYASDASIPARYAASNTGQSRASIALARAPIVPSRNEARSARYFGRTTAIVPSSLSASFSMYRARPQFPAFAA